MKKEKIELTSECARIIFLFWNQKFQPNQLSNGHNSENTT